MNESLMYRHIFDIIQSIAGDKVIITKDMNLLDDIGFDSIQIVEMVEAIENEYSISVNSFGDLIDSFESIDKTIRFFIKLYEDDIKDIKLVDKLTLKKAFANSFSIGTAANKQIVEECGDIILDNFSSITPENELKFDFIHPKENLYQFEKADNIVKFATDNNMLVRGHTLIWHESIPKWLTQYNDKPVSKRILLKRMEEHISVVVDRYKDSIYCWDVVNEVIDDDRKKYLRDSLWKNVLGKDYIENAFNIAHEANPNAKLFLNEYNMCIDYKCEKIVRLLNRLIKRGVPIHGVGIQGHYNINFPSAEAVEAGIVAIASLGLKIHITEMDVSMYGYEDRRIDLSKPTDEMLKRQAEAYEKYFRVFEKYKDVIEGVTLWGVADNYTWLDSFPVKGRKDWPLLFDEKFQKKKAYHYVIESRIKNDYLPDCLKDCEV